MQIVFNIFFFKYHLLDYNNIARTINGFAFNVQIVIKSNSKYLIFIFIQSMLAKKFNVLLLHYKVSNYEYGNYIVQGCLR